MNRLQTLGILLVALLAACAQEPSAPASTVDHTRVATVQEEEVQGVEAQPVEGGAPSQDTAPARAPSDHRAVLQSLAVSHGSSAGLYAGSSSLEESILTWDVIARASLVSTSTSVVERQDGNVQGLKWYGAVLEFRFRVHEYLKGTGPNEIGGLVYLDYDSKDQARQAAAQIANAHDDRWDDRETIVFLTERNFFISGPDYPTASDQFWFGKMAYDFPGSPINGASEAYTVASVYQKLWLPETQSSGASGAVGASEKAFLLDALATGASGGVRGQSAMLTPQTITLTALKSKITALEAEANAGGTPEYRECVEDSYVAIRAKTYKVSQEGQGALIERTDVSVLSGRPAGTLLWSRGAVPGMLPDQTGHSDFYGPDPDIVRRSDADFEPAPDHWPPELGSMMFTMRLVTTRPLPGGAYKFFHWAQYPYLVSCNVSFPTNLQTQYPYYVTVTAPSDTLHEALFDPVDIATAVGADGSNGVLEPTDFALDGTTTTISSLKWEDGAVSMTLNPTASLADYAIDFIDVTGATTLSLTPENASTTPLTWTVPDKPWADGDLLMLRIHKPVSNDATLSGLALSGIDITFSTATTTYTASVPATTTQTTVTPTVNHDAATYHVKLGGVVDDDGTIALAVGANVISVEVTAGDGVTTQTYTVTVTRATPSEPITVTLTPRVEGSETYVNITIEWNDPQPCDGQYMVALYSTSDYLVRFMGFHPAPATTSLSSESYMWWDLRFFPDRWAGVSCDPSDYSGRRELGRVSLRAAHPDNS